MNISKILIANRGEVAIRIARAAHGLGLQTLAIYAEDDVAALHAKRATHKRAGLAACLVTGSFGLSRRAPQVPKIGARRD